MTVERAKELLPIMQAFAEGKTIQFLSKQEQLDGKWLDVWYDCTNPTFSETTTYRIKPTDNDITYAKELIRELLLADTRIGSDWTGYLVDLEERAKKFIEE